MTWKKVRVLGGAAVLALAVLAGDAAAATSFSNSLTGFTGDSTLPATQAAVAAAGFEFDSTAGFSEDPPGSGEFIDPTVALDSSGAHFGDLFFGNGGRNYIRTIEDDYANVSFVAEITMVAPDIDNNDGYFGIGAGHALNFRTPDWTTEFTSVMYWGETEIAEPSIDTFAIRNGDGPFVTTPAPLLTDGTHRVRLTYDWFQKTATFSFDFNHAGGAFAADMSAPSVNVLPLYAADSWPAEPAKLFFGGGSSVVFKDFQVTVSSTPVVYGDLNNNGTITSADWMILRANLYAAVNGSHSDAYFLGDLTADLAINQADFVAFKTLFEAANGAGSFAKMLASVPEPATFALVVSAGLMICVIRRRATNRT